MKADLRRKQLQRFLERHRIDDANIPGIRQGRKNLLRAYGIEDASDIHSGITIKGFGPALKSALWQWRMSIERCFVFNPAEGIDAADTRALDFEIAQKKATLMKALSGGPVALRHLLIPWQGERAAAIGHVNCWARLAAQAEVDAKELGKF
jgi:DNA-binding helix-hairpin-helix protein with protein kinase domain